MEATSVPFRRRRQYAASATGRKFGCVQLAKQGEPNMKDDEIENLFAYGWLDTAVAIVVALLAIAALFFVAGYLT